MTSGRTRPPSNASASARAISPTVLGVPEATLYGPVTSHGTVSASAFARATSLTWMKSRSCPPSSNTRGGSPRTSALRKMLATPAYGVSRGIRGPYTLW